MEAAAVAVAAEQVISTSAQAGVVYGVAKSTPSIRASFTSISSEGYLPRAHHSLCIVEGQAYIFGGQDEKGGLAGDEMHIISLPSTSDKPDYKCVPSLGTELPGPRQGHSAIAIGHQIYMYGGQRREKAIDENGRIWIFDTKSLEWSFLDSQGDSPDPRHGQQMVHYSSSPKPSVLQSTAQQLGAMTTDHAKASMTLAIYGGLDDVVYQDVWIFEVDTRTWKRIPPPPLTSKGTCSFACVDRILYLIDATSTFSGTVAQFQPSSGSYETGSWYINEIPKNPLTPGPPPRLSTVCLPITTGAGRRYLLLAMGETAGKGKAAATNDKILHSDLWAYGVSSSPYTAAGLKDSARSTLGLETPTSSWSEVKLVADIENGAGTEVAMNGKSHPGPRAAFAASTCDQNGSMLLWGGFNARNQVEGDGWLVKFM